MKTYSKLKKALGIASIFGAVVSFIRMRRTYRLKQATEAWNKQRTAYHDLA